MDAFQHKKVAYAYGKNTDGVTLFLKVHHIDQITLLSDHMRHLFDAEINKEDSANPFYMENWKHMTFSHLVQFSQEFNIKLPEIGHQKVFNWITLNLLKLSVPKIKVLQDWMKHHAFASILHVLSNFCHDPNSIGFNTSYKDEDNTPGIIPRSFVHNLKLLCFWDREWYLTTTVPLQTLPGLH